MPTLWGNPKADATNLALPNLVQIVQAKSYVRRSQVHPSAGEAPSGPIRSQSSIGDSLNCDGEVQDKAAGCNHDQAGIPNKLPATDVEFESEARHTLMEATIDGLVNKALISALFLTFNIPAIMNPPIPVDTTDATFQLFFLTACVAIACGVYCVVSATFMASHAKAATVTQSMALMVSDRLAPLFLLNHNAFIVQGMMTSTQVAVVAYSYMDNNWNLWFGIGACVVSFLVTCWTKITVNRVWRDALACE